MKHATCAIGLLLLILGAATVLNCGGPTTVRLPARQMLSLPRGDVSSAESGVCDVWLPSGRTRTHVAIESTGEGFVLALLDEFGVPLAQTAWDSSGVHVYRIFPPMRKDIAAMVTRATAAYRLVSARTFDSPGQFQGALSPHDTLVVFSSPARLDSVWIVSSGMVTGRAYINGQAFRYHKSQGDTVAHLMLETANP